MVDIIQVGNDDTTSVFFKAISSSSGHSVHRTLSIYLHHNWVTFKIYNRLFMKFKFKHTLLSPLHTLLTLLHKILRLPHTVLRLPHTALRLPQT
jgi:hypothetical protein